MEITVGTRIVLDFTDDEYTTLKAGDTGTVAFIDDTGTLHTHWDQGSRLGLIPGKDKFHIEPTACPDCKSTRLSDPDRVDGMVDCYGCGAAFIPNGAAA